MKRFESILMGFLLVCASCWGAGRHMEDMDYPEEAAQAGLHGKVLVLVTIGRDGQVTKSQVLKGNPVLGRYTARNAEKCTFLPKDGPKRKMVYDFQLQKPNMLARIAKLPLAWR